MSEAAEHCILGFEGGWRESHPVTWGSAALWDGERVVNMGSGFGRRGREEWDELVKDGAVTAFSRPIPVKPMDLDRDMFRLTNAVPIVMMPDEARALVRELGDLYVGTGSPTVRALLDLLAELPEIEVARANARTIADAHKSGGLR